MIWLNPVSDFWLNTQAKPKHDMTRMTRLAGSKHLNTGKSRVSVKACYTPTDSSRTFTGRHASNMLKWFNRKIFLGCMQCCSICSLKCTLRARRHPSGLHSAWFLRTRLTVKIFELPLVVATVTILLMINVMSDFVLNFTSKRFFLQPG